MNTVDYDSQPPSICDVCLGDSPNIRLTKLPNGAQCKICTMTFTSYHFKQQERSSNLTKTLICLRCATQRNVCQCCMLDMTWHIPVQLRDSIVSLVNQDKSMITKEAKNDIMKRFLALKDGKLGGAQVTSDSKQTDELMQKLKDILLQNNSKENIHKKTEAISSGDSSNSTRLDNSKLKGIDISHIIRKLPLRESFLDTTASVKSFFLYNIDPSIPEWKVSDQISNIVGTKDWKDPTSLSLIIIHKAKCGGVRFKSEELGSKFVKNMLASGSFMKSNDGKVQRGILKIDHFQIFAIPWRSGFSGSSFGGNVNENIKLSLSMNKLIQLENGASTESELQSEPAKKSVKTPPGGSKTMAKKNKITKPKKSKKRISNLQL